MMVRGRIAKLAGMCLALAACQQEQAPVAVADGDETQAEGEVLPGTISDRMLPYDEIGRNAAPALPPVSAQTPAGSSTTAASSRTRAPVAPAAEEDSPAEAEPEAAPSPAADAQETAAEEE